MILYFGQKQRIIATYIHKLCVRRKYSGIGLSKKMVQLVIEECEKEILSI